MSLSCERRLFRLVFGLGILAAAVSLSILCSLIIERGGILADPTRVEDFSLCQADIVGGKPQPLTSLILTPTSVIYACGYLEISEPRPWNMCLAFDLNRDRETIFRSDSYCLPSHSQFFLYPIRTRGWGIPGKYRLYVYNVASRDWTESVAFEISPSPK